MSNAYVDVPAAGYGLLPINIMSAFPNAPSPISSSQGYQNYQMYGTMYKSFRVHSCTATIRVYSSTVPSQASPDAFEVCVVANDPADHPLNADATSYNSARELPGSQFVIFQAATTMNRRAVFRRRMRPQTIVGMTKEEYRTDISTRGTNLAYATPINGARAYAQPTTFAYLSPMVFNASTVMRSYVVDIMLRTKFEFFDPVFPVSNN